MTIFPRTAVVIFNLGGPDKLEAIRPFLFNLFSDRAILNLPQPLRFLLAWLISKLRFAKAKEIYAQIGGASPLLRYTEFQAHALEQELSFFGDFKVFVSMRYWRPTASEVVVRLKEYNPNKIILLPLYPQFSSATSGSSLQDFVSRIPREIPTKIICCYPSDPDFASAHSRLIKQTISRKNLAELRLLFSAHGLPQSVVDAGDPYVFQVQKTVEMVLKDFPSETDFKICYQSKVGIKSWTKPSLEQELRRAQLDNKIPVIVPISFVSENSETLFELDIFYKNQFKNLLRVPALNSEGFFIKALTEICRAASTNDSSNIFCGRNLQRICDKNLKFCPNSNC